jgi:CMP-N-acetylneuraminic acid synthetase
MQIVTVILARAGSKRLPGKLWRLLKNKPLIEYTIEHALEIGYPVYIYTDSAIIKHLASKYNVNIRDKILENEEGIHRTQEELIHYNQEYNADYIIMLQGTSPYRDTTKIKEWVKDFIASGNDTGLAVYPIDRYIYNTEGNCINADRNTYNKKVKTLAESGSFYIFNTSMLQKKSIFDTEKKMLFIDKYDIDIDTIDDLRKAECVEL